MKYIKDLNIYVSKVEDLRGLIPEDFYECIESLVNEEDSDVTGIADLAEKIAQTYNPIMRLTDVWDDIDFYKEKRYHPTQKPKELIKRLVEVSSNKGDVVIDPFGGSGNTALVCEELERDYYLIELDENYYKKIIERIENER